MSERATRRQLGRGLAALFGETEADASAAGMPQRSVAIELIRPGSLQPRQRFAEAELDALAQSIREKGILQPLLVRPLAEEEADFELVAGERRWRAAQRVGLHEVPVIIRRITDSEALEIALVENLQREDLSPLEEAEAYSRLMDQFGRTQASLAEAVGKSRSHVANTLRLLKLPETVKAHIHSGKLSAGHARMLIGQPNAEELAEEIVARGLNVRQVEAMAREAAPKRGKGNARSTQARAEKSADLVALEKRLADSLGLIVTIEDGPRGGTLTIRYRNHDQLDEVLHRLERKH
jgi:ParB family transcriptional regulator, chromosome partitioning protein